MSMLCPCCGSQKTLGIYASDPLPVDGTTLFRSAEDSSAAAMRGIDLVGCGNCGFAWNQTFDERTVEYGQDYEGTQIHSGHFSRYLEAFAEKCLDLFAPHAPSVLEVGCGQGEFLEAIRRQGGQDLCGYDPAYRAETSNGPPIHAEKLPEIPHRKFDLVINRMTLEHIADPASFMRSLAHWVADGGLLITQVPAGIQLLEKRGLSDLVYEHVNYFTENSLGDLIKNATGFSTEVETVFEGQHLTAVARKNGIRTEEHTPSELPDFSDLERRLRCQPEMWSRQFGALSKSCTEIWLWGAGSRAANVVASVSNPTAIAGVIDINERRVGCYLPGSTCKTFPPEAISGKDGIAIVIMNEAYRDEIAAMTGQLAKNVVLKTLAEL